MLRNGGSPAAYTTRVIRDLRLADSDRSGHELELLLTVLDMAATTDQLNVGNLCSMELVARRIQLVLDANSGGGQANWEAAEHFLGLGKSAKGIAPGLQSHVAQRLKDEAELMKQRDKAREVRNMKPPKGGGRGNAKGTPEAEGGGQ